MSNCPATVIVQDTINQVVQQGVANIAAIAQAANVLQQLDQPAQSVVLLDTQTVSEVEDSVRTIEIDIPGLPGPAGPSSAGVAPIAFSYGDASSAIFTPSQAGVVVLVRLRILTAFDGANPTLKLGTVSQPESILSALQNDPSSTEEYENTPDLALVAGQSVVFTIVPGTGASQGNGTIYLVFVPN